MASRIVICAAYVMALVLTGRGYGDGEVLVVAWENYTQTQQGEWMIEFYAPWCPACKQFEGDWVSLAIKTTDYDVKIAKVDITSQTMLSGIFMVTHLPSVYHIKNGEVRFYDGERNVNDLMEYIREQKWQQTEPVPYWKSPTAPHMYGIGVLFWLSEWAKGLQEIMESQYNIPTYGVFILLAVATIVVGLTLGGITVCIIEMCIRFCSSPKKVPRQKKHPTQPKKEPEPAPAPVPEHQPEVLPPSPPSPPRPEQQQQQEASPVVEKHTPGEKGKGEGARRRRKKEGKGGVNN